jgi:hypothetical protein
MWAVFSGGRLGRRDDVLDSFNLVKLTLVLRTTAANKPKPTFRSTAIDRN